MTLFYPNIDRFLPSIQSVRKCRTKKAFFDAFVTNFKDIQAAFNPGADRIHDLVREFCILAEVLIRYCLNKWNQRLGNIRQHFIFLIGLLLLNITGSSSSRSNCLRKSLYSLSSFMVRLFYPGHIHPAFPVSTDLYVRLVMARLSSVRDSAGTAYPETLPALLLRC